MVQMDINSKLFAMIDQVSQSPSERSAHLTLLTTLLSMFSMDQAAICEKEQTSIRMIIGIDRSKKILQSSEEIWLSRTLMDECLTSMAPAAYHEFSDPKISNQFESEFISRSISENSLKNIVCVPLSQNPTRIIYLASKRDPLRRISEEELNRLRIAAQAAGLALKSQSQIQELQRGNEKLKSVIESKKGSFVYASSLMDSLISEARNIAPFNISILIQGESGCGKEELAREIHRLSGRKGPFLAINCANLTESLLESELFGYTKGAFTGAVNFKRGLFQEADGGTFFLDEIAEIPMGLQAKLLRVLQERTVRPLGSNTDIPVDIRILAASHKDLRAAVLEKKFRDDLYYRIQEMTLFIPSLKERPEDIEILARYFLTHFSEEFKLPQKQISERALDKLRSHSWPGNIRELKNVCRTAIILGRERTLEEKDFRIESGAQPQGRVLAFQAPATAPEKGDLKQLSSQFERDLISRLLSEPGETQNSIAKRLNISVRTLQRILNRESDVEVQV